MRQSSTWSAIVSDSTGKYLLGVSGGTAGVLGGVVQTSSDYGATWNDRTAYGAIPRNYWSSAASDRTGKYLIVADGGDNTIVGFLYTSSSYGTSWTKQSVSGYWTSVASDGSGKYLVAADDGNSASNVIGALYTSNDYGVTWTKQSGNVRAVASDITGQYLAATERSTILLSSDYGTTWDNYGFSSNMWGWSPYFNSIASDSTGNYYVASDNSGDGLGIGSIFTAFPVTARPSVTPVAVTDSPSLKPSFIPITPVPSFSPTVDTLTLLQPNNVVQPPTIAVGKQGTTNASNLSTGSYVGIAIGVIIFLVLVSYAAYIFCNNKRKTDSNKDLINLSN